MEKKIQEAIPQLFQGHLICAGDDEGNQGSCEGDSGGPLMYKDDDGRYIQIATVRGAVGECGDRAYPGIFVRVDHPSVWSFISSVIMPQSKEQNELVAGGKNISNGKMKTCVIYQF